MIRSGQKILSVFLLLPVLTILAHNSIAHHHHGSPFEVCCGNEQSPEDSSHLLTKTGHTAGSHHDACSFNPEFTFEIFKILINAIATDHTRIACPLRCVESEYLAWFTDDALCRIDASPNFLRGPPSLG